MTRPATGTPGETHNNPKVEALRERAQHQAGGRLAERSKEIDGNLRVESDWEKSHEYFRSE
jgi:hypothetical protein